MSFSYDLTASGTALVVARVRLDIGDTIQNDGVRRNGGNFSDEEILDFYSREGSVQAATSARACETLVREWAPAVDEQAGPIRHSYSQAAARWEKAAAAFRLVAGGGAAAFSYSLTRSDGYADLAAEDA
jgi:hypothetical protein